MKKTSKLFLSIMIIVGIVALIVLGVLDQPITRLRTALAAAYEPVYRQSLNLVNGFEQITHLGKMNKALAELERDKIDLLNKIVDETELQKENDALKKALQFKTEKKVTLIPARIFARFKEDNSARIGLDVGENEQVQKGDAVITENGVVLGKIWQLDAETSEALLLIDQKSKIGADVVGVDNFGGIVEGQYGLGIALTTIPHETVIPQGAIVITSGLENNIPRGLLLGQVVEVQSEAREPFARAVLKNLVSADTVTTVFVVKK